MMLDGTARRAHLLAQQAKGGNMPGLKKILLVDDEEDLREALAEQLVATDDFDVTEAGTGAAAGTGANNNGRITSRHRGGGHKRAYRVIDFRRHAEAASGTEAVEATKNAIFDLVVLDVGLPDTDGRELCKKLRKLNVKCPVVMLTGHDTDADTILGLDAGANDYITKPFKFPVLLARLRAQLRTHEQSEDAIFQLGPYTFKPAMKMLIDSKDRKIRLTEKETNILKFLYRAQDGVVARDVLLHEVWGYNAGVTTHTLETHIYRLRQKIEPDPSNARLLVTESGGYRLVA